MKNGFCLFFYMPKSRLIFLYNWEPVAIFLLPFASLFDWSLNTGENIIFQCSFGYRFIRSDWNPHKLVTKQILQKTQNYEYSLCHECDKLIILISSDFLLAQYKTKIFFFKFIDHLERCSIIHLPNAMYFLTHNYVDHLVWPRKNHKGQLCT